VHLAVHTTTLSFHAPSQARYVPNLPGCIYTTIRTVATRQQKSYAMNVQSNSEPLAYILEVISLTLVPPST
jgi:hypothetical protein